MMDSSRKAAMAVGILYIAGTVAGMASMLCLAPVSVDADFFAKAASRETMIRLGAVFILVMGFSLAFIPAVIFPVLKKRSESLAMAYVVFRGALETGLYIASAFSWLFLIGISRQSAISAALYAGAQGLLFDVLLPIVFSIGASILYTAFFRSRLIPRWLSVWGLIAILLHLTTGILALFGVLSSWSAITMAMNFPIFLQEMVMAVWLIAKGFNQSIARSE
jgi:hypothetical protein